MFSLFKIFCVILFIQYTASFYDTSFSDVLVDFLRIQENAFHLNIFMDSEERIFMRNLTRALTVNEWKWKMHRDSRKFLLNNSNIATQLNIIDVESEEILKEADKLGLFKSPYRWFIQGNVSILQKYGLYFRVDSRIFICEKITEGYNISTIYKVNQSVDQYQLESIGQWEPEVGFVNYKPLSIFNQRRNLKNTKFTLSYLFNSPSTYTTLFEYRMTHIDSSPRFTFLITHTLISMFNVEPEYIIQTSYGNPIPNSSEYTGIIGDVKNGRAIMGATPIFLVGGRVSFLEYIAPNAKSYLNFYFKSPPLSYVSNIFVKPFNENVWYSCFILTALTLLTMYTIVRWEWKESFFRKQVQHRADATHPTISSVAILQLGVISQQGSDTELKSSSGRIAMIFALVAFMFLYTAYSANIVAILQSTSNSINDLKDLLDSKIELGVEKVPYLMPIFKFASDPTAKEIYKRRLKPKGDKFMMPLLEGTEKMRTQFFAFYTEASSINKLMSDYFDEAEKCSVRQVEYSKIREPWIIAQKHGSYTELLKIGMFRLRELGFYMAERKRIFYDNPPCHTKISRFFSAGLIDTYPGFIFFGVGCSISLLVLLVEFVLKKLKSSRFRTHNLCKQPC